jgi:hypothetical protein
MLTKDEKNQIESLLLNEPSFLKSMNDVFLFEGKEKGHSNASPIEDVISDILVSNLNAKKAVGSRELGDVYINDNFINIKFGDEGFGQPNMCSMNRIMKKFVESNEIDSYNIIKVKMTNDAYSIKVFDMFDYIDYITWNSGTGQIMLKEAEFYRNIDLEIESISIEEKKKKIAELYIKGQNEHINLRIKQKDKKIKLLKKMGII